MNLIKRLVVISLIIMLLPFTNVEGATKNKSKFILTGTNVYVKPMEKTESENPVKYEYSYLEIDSMKSVKFEQMSSFNLNDGNNYYVFEMMCTNPAETIEVGSVVKLKLELVSEEHRPNKKLEIPTEISASERVYINTSGIGSKKSNILQYFTDKNNKSKFTYNVEDGNDLSCTVSLEMPNNLKDGEKISIYFETSAGYYEWIYTYKKSTDVTISSAKVKNNKITIKVKSTETVDGYQYQVATSKKFKNATTKESTKTKYSIKIAKGTNYIRVRSYTINTAGEKEYGVWSKVKTIK